MGSPGLVQSARDFLRDNNDLAKFAAANETEFNKLLDRATSAMQRKLVSYFRPGKSGWGPSRKLLNIYLRDCCYNYRLRKTYRLGTLERWLEVPLDKEVMTFLLEQPEADTDLRRVAVSELTPALSRRFQFVAGEVAKRLRSYRAGIDVFAWRRQTI